jgi:hypothetical protein
MRFPANPTENWDILLLVGGRPTLFFLIISFALLMDRVLKQHQIIHLLDQETFCSVFVR